MPDDPAAENDDRRRGLVETFVDGLLKYRLLLFVFSLAVAGAAVGPALSLRFDQRISSLYAADDPNRTNYIESRALFGGDELAIVAWAQSDLFAEGDELDPEVQRSLDDFSERLSAVPGINAESTQTLADALRVPYARDKVRRHVEGLLVDRTGETTGIVLRFTPEDVAPVDPKSGQPTTRGETIRRLRELAAEHERETGFETYVLGEPVQIHDMFRFVEEDGSTFFRWTLVLLGVVAFAVFRSVRWTVLPLLVVVVTIVWTRGLFGALGVSLSMVGSMLNSIVTIVGVATVTHVAVRFRSLRRDFEPEEALRRTLVELLPAVFWTCATTFVGFAALLSSSIAPVRSFGVMMGLATVFVFVSVCTLLPAGTLLGRPSHAAPHRTGGTWLTGALERLSALVGRRPQLLFWSGAGLAILGVVGIPRLSVETDFSQNFHDGSNIIRSLEFYEARMGGAGTWELNFPAPEKLDDAYLTRVRRVAERLRSLSSEDGVSHVVALTDGLDLVPRSVGKPPFELQLPITTRLKSIGVVQPEFVPGLYNPKEGRMRIVLRAYERVPADRKREIIARAETIAREEFPEAKASGLYVLLVFLVESLLRDQVTSFALAAIGVLLVMSIAFRSPWLGLIGLVPNLFPLCIVMGGMGWLGVKISIGTTMIACVSLGLTTDATVHIVSKLLRSGRATDFAMARTVTLVGTGRAIVYATLALVVGFSVLVLSNFVPLVVFGLLVVASMLIGLYGDLVMLPILLGWWSGTAADEEENTA